jgi:hypothetical protein
MRPYAMDVAVTKVSKAAVMPLTVWLSSSCRTLSKPALPGTRDRDRDGDGDRDDGVRADCSYHGDRGVDADDNGRGGRAVAHEQHALGLDRTRGRCGSGSGGGDLHLETSAAVTVASRVRPAAARESRS